MRVNQALTEGFPHFYSFHCITSTVLINFFYTLTLDSFLPDLEFLVSYIQAPSRLLLASNHVSVPSHSAASDATLQSIQPKAAQVEGTVRFPDSSRPQNLQTHDDDPPPVRGEDVPGQFTEEGVVNRKIRVAHCVLFLSESRTSSLNCPIRH